MGAAMNKALTDRGVPTTARMYLLHCVARVLCYWLPNLLLHIATKKGWGKQWKIQGDKMPSDFLSRACFLDNVGKDLYGQIPASIIFYKLLTLGKLRPKVALTNYEEPKGTLFQRFFIQGKQYLKSAVSAVSGDEEPEEPKSTEHGEPQKEMTSETSVIEKSGWAGLRFTGPYPSLWTHVWQVAVGYLGFDLMFYFSHRLMHHKMLYKHCHKMHHQFHTPIGTACAWEHIIETIVQLLQYYLPIGFAGYMNRHNGGLHISTLFFHHCFRWIETVDSHSGYELPFSPFNLLWPIFGGSRMHDYHHREFNGNYGSSFIWDRLFGTDVGFWKEVFEEGGFLVGGKRIPLR